MRTIAGIVYDTYGAECVRRGALPVRPATRDGASWRPADADPARRAEADPRRRTDVGEQAWLQWQRDVRHRRGSLVESR